MAIVYIPHVRCRKCGKMVDGIKRVHDPKIGARSLRVTCHGATADIPFSTAPGATVEVFGDEPDGEKKEEPEPVLVLTDRPQSTTKLQGLGQFDRTLAHAVDDINRNRAMKEVVSLPDGLNGMIAAMNARAKTAMARLAAADTLHATSCDRVNKVAEVIEEATAKTNHFVDEMIGGNGGPKEAPLAGTNSSTDSSQQSAA